MKSINKTPHFSILGKQKPNQDNIVIHTKINRGIQNHEITQRKEHFQYQCAVQKIENDLDGWLRPQKYFQNILF